MKLILSFLLSLIIVAFLTTISSAYSMPYTSPQGRFFASDVVLIGKIISIIPYSSTYTKYTVKVEQYLKNPQHQDELTVTAFGARMENETRTPQNVFSVGERIFFYLHKDQENYQVLQFSYPTDSLCDPAPTLQELNSEQIQNMTAGSVLYVRSNKPLSPLYVNQPVTIFYDAWNDNFITKTFDVEFNIKNGTDAKIVYNDLQKIELKPCIGYKVVHTSFIPHKAGRYEIEVNFNGSRTATIMDIINNTLQNRPNISPLKQFKSGIDVKEVTCINEFTLVIKSEDGSPSCVKPNTATVLIERGWGHLP